MKSSLILSILVISCAARTVAPSQPSSEPVVSLVRPGEIVPERAAANREAFEAFAIRRIKIATECKISAIDCESRVLQA